MDSVIGLRFGVGSASLSVAGGFDMILSMFREEPVDGKPGPVSMRRVLAFLLVLAAAGLFVGGFWYEKDKWYVFIPGIACLVGALLLLFFTTWEDIAEIARSIKKK